MHLSRDYPVQNFTFEFILKVLSYQTNVNKKTQFFSLVIFLLFQKNEVTFVVF